MNNLERFKNAIKQTKNDVSIGIEANGINTKLFVSNDSITVNDGYIEISTSTIDDVLSLDKVKDIKIEDMIEYVTYRFVLGNVDYCFDIDWLF